ncbi:hypothetical protein TH63_18190 [Rufibacter radiotolerans]|uniref:HTTM domain-containing protein n=1 Tax=Rufibacter radiotolerans TaxID=1379910 RepID=A0A0H4VT79_9BACT|nr:hypothetical protein [Rufibacter radiotolerans]AKQ47132.1 hypothetical protein TH63_18190 [Rufibacter radiotolerans]
MPVSNATAQTRGKLTESSLQNRYLRAVVDFFYAEQALRLFTFVWLYWALEKYVLYLQRPADLFEPLTLVGKLVAPELPAKELFWTVAAVCAVANLVKLFHKKSLVLQAVLAAGLLWMNLVLWSYGYLPHVNHLFLLAHLFLVFVVVEAPAKNHPDRVQYASINWFYFGLLFVYTLSGLWKIAALGKKLISASTDVHWLKPEAALYNAVVSFRDYDQPFTMAQLYTDFPWVWQLGFLVIVYVLTSAVAAAWHSPLRPWVGGFLVLFHLINQFAFLIFFVVACLTLVCLFFPYGLLFRQYRQKLAVPVRVNFEGKGNQARYRLQYQQQDQEEVFTDFEAYRQRLLDSNYYLAGLLYLPGVKAVTRLWWKLLPGAKGNKPPAV